MLSHINKFSFITYEFGRSLLDNRGDTHSASTRTRSNAQNF